MNNNVYYLAQKKRNYNNIDIKEKKRKRRIFMLLLFLIITIFIFSYSYLKNNRIVMITADYGEITDGFKTKGLVIRDEYIYYTPDSGYVNFLSSEGHRVGYGQNIVRINSRILYNYQAGLVSFAIDGLEESLNPANINKITVANFFDYKRNFRQNIDNDYIRKGQAVFRIINNNELYIVILAERKEVNRYRIMEKVFIQAEELGDKIIEASVVNKRLEDDKGLLIIKTNIFLTEWLNIRWADFTFIKNIYRGIVIPRKAVFTSPAGEGVLIYNTSTGDYKFNEVQVLDGNQEMLTVNGINIGDKVITNPEDLNFGRGVE